MKEGFGDYALCLLCDHYKVAHNNCCPCKNYTARGLILVTLDSIIRNEGSVDSAEDSIPVSKAMLELLASHMRSLTVRVRKEQENV